MYHLLGQFLKELENYTWGHITMKRLQLGHTLLLHLNIGAPGHLLIFQSFVPAVLSGKHNQKVTKQYAKSEDQPIVSERVDKCEAVGERLKESEHINRSLSALGDVIAAFAQKSPHVPYRNSKLTEVLQYSLGGHAKTLMFVHLNPEVNAIGETISALKLAERVASIELGVAKTNKETSKISKLRHILEKKEAEIEQMRAGNTRSTAESERTRAVSPFYMLDMEHILSRNLKRCNAPTMILEI